MYKIKILENLIIYAIFEDKKIFNIKLSPVHQLILHIRGPFGKKRRFTIIEGNCSDKFDSIALMSKIIKKITNSITNL